MTIEGSEKRVPLPEHTETAEVEPRVGIITLPNDERLRSALEEKLKEYTERLNQVKNVPIEKLPYGYKQDHKYRIELLQRLLASKSGEVDVQAYAKELIQKEQDVYGDLEEEDFDKEIYMRACLIVNDYVKKGKSERFAGTGTGLQFPKEQAPEEVAPVEEIVMEPLVTYNPDGTREALVAPRTDALPKKTPPPSRWQRFVVGVKRLFS